MRSVSFIASEYTRSHEKTRRRRHPSAYRTAGLREESQDQGHQSEQVGDDDQWGPDQLGEEVLAKGDSFTLTNIDCDEYDIKVVDEDGDECIIEAVSLCRDNSYWKITDKELLECEGHQ